MSHNTRKRINLEARVYGTEDVIGGAFAVTQGNVENAKERLKVEAAQDILLEWEGFFPDLYAALRNTVVRTEGEWEADDAYWADQAEKGNG